MSRSKGLAVLAAVAVLGVLSPADAADLVVDAGGGGDYTTIQAAVNDLPAVGPLIVKIKTGTYHEAVTISRKNASAQTESHRVVLMADPDVPPGSVVVIPPRGRNAFTIERSRFITLKGLTVTGASRDGVHVRGGGAANRDITLDSHHLHHNGSASGGSGIFVGRENPRTWVVNNLDSGTERVPAKDFEGDPRPVGLPAIGFDERP
jgi:Pectinesterase